MKKRIIGLSAALLLAGCTNTKALSEKTVRKEGEEMNLMIATDLHYLDPSLYDKDSMVYKSLLMTNDGKLINGGKEILDTFTDKALEEKPDAVLMTGDLTFNGEMVSMQAVKLAFEKIQEAGIPVLVVPGNHDINYPYAYRYSGEDPVAVGNVSEKEFRQMMQEFGYADAVKKDKHSFSYLYQLSDDFYVLALDANTEDAPGNLKEETMTFAKDALAYVREQGGSVISMTHQNVLKQNEFMYQGFVIDDYEKLDQILLNGNVSLNLSGHSHLQHTSAIEGLTDICTESLSVYPLRYSSLHVSSDRSAYDYQMRNLGILQDEAKEIFSDTVRRMVYQQIQGMGIEADVKSEMVDFATRLNIAVFSGENADKQAMKRESGYEAWGRYAGDTFWYSYMQSYLNENKKTDG